MSYYYITICQALHQLPETIELIIMGSDFEFFDLIIQIIDLRLIFSLHNNAELSPAT